MVNNHHETIDPKWEHAQPTDDSSLTDLALLTENNNSTVGMFSPITQRTVAHGIYPHTNDDLCRPPHAFIPPIPLIHTIVTPLTFTAWEKALATHPERQLVAYILAGIQQGFRIGFNCDCPLISARQKIPSAEENPQVVSNYLETEMQEKRVIGSLPMEWHSQVHTSRFGVIPKGHHQGKWRLILDSSFPGNASVNSGRSALFNM